MMWGEEQPEAGVVEGPAPVVGGGWTPPWPGRNPETWSRGRQRQGVGGQQGGEVGG